MLLIGHSLVTEADTGMENLWRSGHSGGHHNYADFGQCMPKEWFHVYPATAALM